MAVLRGANKALAVIVRMDSKRVSENGYCCCYCRPRRFAAISVILLFCHSRCIFSARPSCVSFICFSFHR